VDTDKLEKAVQSILKELGYKPDEHMKRTPARVAEWLMDFEAVDLNGAGRILEVVFPENVPGSLVIVGPVEYRSLCAHHLLPVNGKAWVGYLPDDGICGLSKLARLVEYFATRLTVQERVTNQIADAIEEFLKPKGCMVVVSATHMCMSFRGVRDGDASTVTSAVRGVHETSDNARSEFLSLMKGYR